MKKILVTGGAGFIGSNFIRLLLKTKKYKIVNYDALTYAGNLENLREINDSSNYKFVKGSITNTKLVNKIFLENEFDYVINFAAESHVDKSIESPEIFVETNVKGTQILLDACKSIWQIGIDGDGYPVYKSDVKYLQISTDEVYGDLGKVGMFTEKTPLQPNSPYSASKAAADLIVRSYFMTYKMPVNITRCSNNYGPYQFPEKLIPLMIYNCINNKKLPVYGDGLQIRDWLHVEDHCKAIELVLLKGKLGEVYNIGGNNEKTNIDIVKLIIKVLGKSDLLIEYVNDRLGHDRRYAVANDKILNELGWSPHYTFENGMKETITWYQENVVWLDSIIDGSYLENNKKISNLVENV